LTIEPASIAKKAGLVRQGIEHFGPIGDESDYDFELHRSRVAVRNIVNVWETNVTPE
jgi:hypothetical protein